jgi:hypothetical protein
MPQSTIRPLANRRAIIDDPVALQVIWTRLIAIADEAAATLRRTRCRARIAGAPRGRRQRPARYGIFCRISS